MHLGSDIAALVTLLTGGALLVGATIKVTRAWTKMASDISKLSRNLADHIATDKAVTERWQQATMARIRHDERRLTAIERIIGLLSGGVHNGRSA